MLLISSNKPLPIHSVHWGISAKPPPSLNLKTVQAPFFRQSPLYIGFSVNLGQSGKEKITFCMQMIFVC